MKQIWKSHGKDKYCKECWYSIERPAPIRPVSQKMQKTMDQYTKARKAFLALHTMCGARLKDCTKLATDVHHKAGRGENHLNLSTWIAVCRNCHQWIEEHPIDSKLLGLSQDRLN